MSDFFCIAIMRFRLIKSCSIIRSSLESFPRVSLPWAACWCVLGAVLVTMTIAHLKGRAELEAFHNAIVISDNASRVSVTRLQAMALSVSQTTGTQGQAARVLVEMIGQPCIATENFEQLAATIIAMHTRSGVSVTEILGWFSELGKSPVQASIKFNERYDYLSTAVYAQITELEAQGHFNEAADLAQKVFSHAIDERTARLTASLGSVERGWDSVRKMVAVAWDAMLDLGRQKTPVEDLQAIEKELQRLTGAPFEGADGVLKIRFSSQYHRQNANREWERKAISPADSQRIIELQRQRDIVNDGLLWQELAAQSAIERSIAAQQGKLRCDMLN